MLDKISKIAHITREIAVVKPENIPFRQYVVEACARNACGRYGKTWTCPPGVGELEELKRKWLSYSSAIVFTTCHDIEDSFDIEGMEEGRKKHERITDEAIAIFEGEDIAVMSAEGCDLCKVCTYPTSPCRYPDVARSSVEANGISVVELARDCGIHYKNEPNTVTYFSIIFVR